MFIVFLGPPGVGKGTQCSRVSESFDLPHISTGEIFRDAIRNKTEQGLKFKQFVDDGQLVPDELVVAIVADRLNQDDCQQGCLFDGFPRTVEQAKALDEHFEATGRRIAGVIQLKGTTEEVQRRLLQRAEKEGRSDDTPETIAARLRVYETQTAPLIEYYGKQNLLHPVDGLGTLEEVFERINIVVRSFSGGVSG